MTHRTSDDQPQEPVDHAQNAIDSTQAALDESRGLDMNSDTGQQTAYTDGTHVLPDAVLASDIAERPDKPTTLLEATIRLTEKVAVLSDRLTISTRQALYTRILLGLVVLIMVVGGTLATVQWHRVTGAVDGTRANAVQNCENANESRAANLQLWNYVLDISTAGDTDPSNAENLKQFKHWVALLFQPHDCSDLGRVYKIPPPPTLSAP